MDLYTTIPHLAQLAFAACYLSFFVFLFFGGVIWSYKGPRRKCINNPSFFCFLSFSEVHGLFDDTVSEVNGIPVPIQFGLPQEEKSIAGERLLFFFFSEAVLSPGRTQSYEGHSDCLPQISSFVFKKSYQCARTPGGRGRRGIRNQLRQINDYIFFSVSYNLYFRFPGPPTMSSPISYLSGLIPLYYHNAGE